MPANTQKYQREYLFNERYGISTQDYNRMFEKQKGRCAICGGHQVDFSRALAVDHDHKTSKVRGLLCINCNNGLGFFKDSRGILIKAIQYLGKRKK